MNRAQTLNSLPQTAGPVLYWMSRDQRVEDNWALLYAQDAAIEQQKGLVVVFCFQKSYLGATPQQESFMLEGLRQVRLKLKEYAIPFFLLDGNPVNVLPSFIEEIHAGLVVTDFNPLRISRKWREEVARCLTISVVEVDAHNVVPYFEASSKQEFAAYTFRPKINRLRQTFLTDFPILKKKPYEVSFEGVLEAYEKQTLQQLHQEKSLRTSSGELAAQQCLKTFLDSKIQQYAQRNDPNLDVCSGLSPYLHFGQISAQRVAWEVLQHSTSAEDFLEELIVRRELSDNYCYYNHDYDNSFGFPDWAKKTLNEHRKDTRAYLYSLDILENANTHDSLWNAAQLEMNKTGKMHGYMRMYWAKKILEWSESAEIAQSRAIFLNDTYSLDGRDPNGYTGIAWSIGGVHDRAWGERAIFGKIRYMSLEGCKRKFNTEQYIQRANSL